MDCPACGSHRLPVPIDEPYRGYAPGDPSAVWICTHCLDTEPIEAGELAPETPDFTRISKGFPEDSEAGTAMVLMVLLIDSIAIYREELSELVERVERAGVDPVLVLERLSDDPSIEPRIDLERRRHQLVQLVT